ncbi:MAG: hypothetical protein U0800_06350 [Isosphaeraceae bacterium]
MTRILLKSLDRTGAPPLEISERLRGQLVYFAAPPGSADAPPLGDQEYWFRPDEVARILEDGVFYLVSPLDTAKLSELELTDEQEVLLEWLKARGVRHARVEE